MSFYRIQVPHDPIKCKYLVYTFRLSGQQQTIHLPLIHVRLQSESRVVGSVGLVDSGSTVTFVPFELAEVLDLPHIAENTESIGAGGTFSTFIARLRGLQLVKGSTIFSDFVNAHVHVPTEPDRIPYVILGRDHIFKRFEVTFQENNRRMVLHHHKWARKMRAHKK